MTDPAAGDRTVDAPLEPARRPPPPVPRDPLALPRMTLNVPAPGPRLLRAARWAAGAACVLLSALWIQNLLDPPPAIRSWFVIWIVTFPFTFFAFGVTIVRIASWSGTGFRAIVGTPTPWWSTLWRVAAAVALIALFAVGDTSDTPGSSGQPTADGDRYYLVNHGVRTEITEDRYREISRSWSRGFAAGQLVFAGGALLILTLPHVGSERPDRA